MAASDAQKRATARYQKRNTTSYSFRLGVNDGDIKAWLDAQPNKQGYLKRLMREDMEKARAHASASPMPEDAVGPKASSQSSATEASRTDH